MKKIPTLFVRDPETGLRYVTRQVHPDCGWVIAGEGVATRKYDGTCVMFDGTEWWARREVKPEQTFPAGWQQVGYDEVTGKSVGWVPMEGSQWERWHAEAVEYIESLGIEDERDIPWEPGTFELLGPKVNGDPDRFGRHTLARHGMDRLTGVPRDFDGLRDWLLARPYEGIVWHHEDGRMAKLKRKDFPR